MWLARLIQLNRFKSGAEVGVAGGRTTSYILSRCPSLKRLYAVDLWQNVPPTFGGGTQYRTWDHEEIYKWFNKRVDPYRDRLIVIREVSWVAADHVEDNSLDFVFIDADHEYRSVVNDIEAWTPKIRPGGVLSGHDTHFPGVKKAIDELIPGWNEAGVDHVWWIRV